MVKMKQKPSRSLNMHTISYELDNTGLNANKKCIEFEIHFKLKFKVNFKFSKKMSFITNNCNENRNYMS